MANMNIVKLESFTNFSHTCWTSGFCVNNKVLFLAILDDLVMLHENCRILLVRKAFSF